MPVILTSLIAKLGIKGMVAIGLGLALLAALLLHRHDVHVIEGLRTKNAQTEARLEISNASIATLKAAIALQNADIEKRASAYQTSLKQAEIDAEALQKAARQSQGQIDKLRALSAVKGSGQCEVPAELTDALSGL